MQCSELGEEEVPSQTKVKEITEKKSIISEINEVNCRDYVPKDSRSFDPNPLILSETGFNNWIKLVIF